MSVASNNSRQTSYVKEDSAGGTDASGNAFANDRGRRNVSLVTTDNTADQVAWSETLPIVNGAYVVAADIVGNRTDTPGDAAYFSLRVGVLRTSEALTEFSAAEVLAGEPADADHQLNASAWRARLDVSSGTSVRLLVTGDTGKTIHWSGTVRYLECV